MSFHSMSQFYIVKDVRQNNRRYIVLKDEYADMDCLRFCNGGHPTLREFTRLVRNGFCLGSFDAGQVKLSRNIR